MDSVVILHRRGNLEAIFSQNSWRAASDDTASSRYLVLISHSSGNCCALGNHDPKAGSWRGSNILIDLAIVLVCREAQNVSIEFLKREPEHFQEIFFSSSF